MFNMIDRYLARGCPMVLLRFIKILMVLTMGLSISSPSLAAKQAPARLAYMKPVTIHSPHKGADRTQDFAPLVKGSYQLACGELFRGILVREKSTTETRAFSKADEGQGSLQSNVVVEVAMVVDRSEAFCSSLPTTVEFFLPVRERAVVRPIKLKSSQRILLEEALDVGIADRSLIVGWQSACRPLAGIILRPLLEQGVPKMEISLARHPSDAQTQIPQVNCVREIRQTKMIGLQLPSDGLTVAERPGKIENSYFTRLVAPQMILRSKDGNMIVAWQKHCRERAVGLVFMGPQGHEVAVVTAVMPSATCARGPRSTSDLYVLPGLMLSRTDHMRPARQSDLLAIGKKFSFNYSFVAAASVDLDRLGKGEPLTASAQGLPCSESIGLVAGGDTYGNVAIGILMGASNSVCTIHQRKFAQRLTAPLLAPLEGPMPRIFGLRVFGTLLN